MAGRLCLLLICLVLLFPLYAMVSGSFQPITFTMVFRLIPRGLTIENYRILLEGTEVLRWIRNTLLIVLLTVALAVTVSATAGYGFAIYNFRGKRLLWTLLLAMIVIPGQVLVIPSYVIIRHLGLANTYWAAVLPRCLSVMGIVLFHNYIRHIPGELVEAGRVAGASEVRIMTRLMLPLCAPMAGVVSLFYGMMAFQDFLWQLLVLQRTAHRTLIVGLVLRLRQLTITYNAVGVSLAVGTLMFIPLLCIFLATNRAFLRGLTLDGVKG